MATTKVYGTLKLVSTAGKTQTIELPELNNTITGSNRETAQAMFDDQVASIAAAYADDDGFGLATAELSAHTLTSSDAFSSTVAGS